MGFMITEPHPTVQANAYVHAGRGGAGNFFRAPSNVTPASGIPQPFLTTTTSHASHSSGASTTASTATRFYTGRGGAGNAHPIADRRSFSLDDEYAYAAAASRATSGGMVGRGGAGNFYKSPADVSKFARGPADVNVDSESAADKIAASLRKLGRKGSDASAASDASSSTSESSARGRFWSR